MAILSQTNQVHTFTIASSLQNSSIVRKIIANLKQPTVKGRNNCMYPQMLYNCCLLCMLCLPQIVPKVVVDSFLYSFGLIVSHILPKICPWTINLSGTSRRIFGLFFKDEPIFRGRHFGCYSLLLYKNAACRQPCNHMQSAQYSANEVPSNKYLRQVDIYLALPLPCMQGYHILLLCVTAATLTIKL